MGSLLACMDSSGQEKNLFWVLAVAPSTFDSHFKVWKCLIPNHASRRFQESPRKVYNCGQGSLGDFLIPSQRTVADCKIILENR